MKERYFSWQVSLILAIIFLLVFVMIMAIAPNFLYKKLSFLKTLKKLSCK
jgi:hypothetical protein